MSRRLNYINNGGTVVTEIRDRKIPTELDPECKRSQEEGWFGRNGLNKQSMNESQAENFNHYADINGDE